MINKKKLSKKYLLIYILTILFSVIYSGFFLAVCTAIALTPFFLIDIYFIPVFIGSVGILWALLPRGGKRNDNFIVNDDKSYEKNIKSIAEALGSTYPSIIQVVFDTNAFAYSYKGKEAIALGIPLIVMMDKHELSAVIAHELAHHFQGDVKYGKNIKKVDIVFTKLMNALNNKWADIIAGPYKIVAKNIFKTIRSLSRKNEFDADIQAANIIGKYPTISALKKIELNNDLWLMYLYNWIWLLNENKIYVDIIENFKKFAMLSQVNVYETEITPKYASEFDSHPSIYERINEVMANSVDDDGQIQVEEYKLDNVALSLHFWNNYIGTTGDKISAVCIINNSYSALEVLSKRIVDEYKYIFGKFTYNDASSINSIYSDVSYALHQKTHNDNYEFERDMIIRILSFMIFEKFKPEKWEISLKFTPIIVFDEVEYDLYSIILQNFNFNNSAWKTMIASLNIDCNDVINENAT